MQINGLVFTWEGPPSHFTHCVKYRNFRRFPGVKIFWKSCGVVVNATAQLNSTNNDLRFCAGSNPTRSISETFDGENFCRWSRVEIWLIAFRRSTIPEKQLIIVISSSSSSSSTQFPQSFLQLTRHCVETFVSTKFIYQKIRWNYCILYSSNSHLFQCFPISMFDTTNHWNNLKHWFKTG